MGNCKEETVCSGFALMALDDQNLSLNIPDLSQDISVNQTWYGIKEKINLSLDKFYSQVSFIRYNQISEWIWKAT